MDRHAAGDPEVGHADLAIPEDGHIFDLVLVVVECLHFFLPAPGDLAEDLPDPWQQGLHKILGPALQGLGQHRVVGVGHGVDGDIPGGVPIKARVIHQDSH